ncbi:hypothetical protein AWZ03_000244 [Drosophila navojoa]|uniref:Uncharacterized protein n=1 Tax=Drosophila navojoa TaxID=7232 RepID=A0A484BX75_DRONA|nr:hypothetical protein AWZ03_000244 [Drosophila navojoa]
MWPRTTKTGTTTGQRSRETSNEKTAEPGHQHQHQQETIAGIVSHASRRLQRHTPSAVELESISDSVLLCQLLMLVVLALFWLSYAWPARSQTISHWQRMH